MLIFAARERAAPHTEGRLGYDAVGQVDFPADFSDPGFSYSNFRGNNHLGKKMTQNRKTERREGSEEEREGRGREGKGKEGLPFIGELPPSTTSPAPSLFW